LSLDTPQNSFRQIAERLVSGSDYLVDVGVVTDTQGIRSHESGSIFTLSAYFGDSPLQGPRRICYVYIQVRSDEFKKLR
jgi:hypothetical protein